MPKKLKKIKPAEMTDAMQKINWAALFRNDEKAAALQKAVIDFDEIKIREIFGNDFFVGRAAYVDDDSIIWEKFIQLRINLTLPKEVIMAEVGTLVSQYQKKYKLQTNKRIVTKSINEVFQVWDLYQQAGKQPAGITFKDTARITGRPLSTIKDQWRAAYKKIYGIPYDPSLKYTSEEKKQEATEVCCKTCKYLTSKKTPCGYDEKTGDFYGCAEYNEIAGKEKNAFDEYMDDVSNSIVEDNFCDDLERIDNIKYKPSDKK